MEQLPQEELIKVAVEQEALSQWLKNPRGTVIQAEALTAAITVLLLLQLILGSYRRQSSCAVVQKGTYLAYVLLSPLIAYTLALIQHSPVKSAMDPIWATSLLMAIVRTNAVNTCKLDDNKQSTRTVVYQCVTHVCIICRLLDYLFRTDYLPSTFPECLMFALACGYLSLCILLACLFVDEDKSPRRVAKFVKNQLAATNDDGFDPVSMKGYKYPLYFQLGKIKWFPFPSSTVKTDDAITIDQIWQCEGRLLSSAGTDSSGLKDVCLAFSLYVLLKQRYYRMACAEENRPETHDFVFKGLLRNEGDYERAFRIVEMELGFCHDHFFTKYPTIFADEKIFFILFLQKIILIVILGVDVLTNSISIITPDVVPTETADNVITLLILFTILVIEILQAAFYFASDWFKVSVICRYVTKSHYQGSACIEKVIRYLVRFTIFGYWKNRIDQYSIISDSTAQSVCTLNMVKRAIARYLTSCDGHLTNGEQSLMNNDVLGEFSLALQGRSQVQIMLIWIIATEYCHIAPTSTSTGERMNEMAINEEELRFHRQVSVNLSRYCAYLIKFAPELLPGYLGDTVSDMDDVQKEVSRVSSSKNVGEKYQAMKGLEDEVEDSTIFMRGLKLGKQLDDMPDSALRWKVMGDFWAEKILHAGILKINREYHESTMASQLPRANV